VNDRAFVAVADVLLESFEDIWTAYSPASGKSFLLNDEGAAIVTLLDVATPRTATEICESLGEECGMPPADIRVSVEPVWNELIEAGLIRSAPLPGFW
jgi:PqqD family protein of HPr-rel-A system